MAGLYVRILDEMAEIARGIDILAGHVQSAQALRRIGASTLVVVGDQDMEAFKRSAELIRRAVGAQRVSLRFAEIAG